jgi:hypothetical protein
MKQRIEQQRLQREILEKYFACSRTEETDYIKQLAKISNTIVIDLNHEKIEQLSDRYEHNRNARRGRATPISPILTGLVGFPVTAVAITFLVLGIGTYGVGLIFLLACALLVGAVIAITSTFFLGLFIYSKFQEFKENQNFDLDFKSDLDRKLVTLIESNQFDQIDFSHLHYTNAQQLSQSLSGLYQALRKNDTTALILPSDSEVSLRVNALDKESLILQFRNHINSKSISNGLKNAQNKYSIFHHQTSNFLPKELHYILFGLLQRIYFPNQQFPLYKKLEDDSRPSIKFD